MNKKAKSQSHSPSFQSFPLFRSPLALLSPLKIPSSFQVLIFSTYTQLLDLIEDYADMKKYEYRRLDGNTNIDDRREYMKDFNTNPNIFLFLLSTRAGGLGINLTGADTVIIFNSDWVSGL